MKFQKMDMIDAANVVLALVMSFGMCYCIHAVRVRRQEAAAARAARAAATYAQKQDSIEQQASHEYSGR